MQKKLQTIRNQKGFTLVEIIAVLIILGILAAVAIPRYIDLQEQARVSAAQGAIAEIRGRLSTAYGSWLLQNDGGQPPNVAALCAADYADLQIDTSTELGDFTYTLSENPAGTAVITITHVNQQQLDAAVVDDWLLP